MPLLCGITVCAADHLKFRVLRLLLRSFPRLMNDQHVVRFNPCAAVRHPHRLSPQNHHDQKRRRQIQFLDPTVLPRMAFLDQDSRHANGIAAVKAGAIAIT